MTVHAVTDEAGKVMEGSVYEPFGSVTVVKPRSSGEVEWSTADVVEENGSSSIGNPLQYTARRHDDETGLHQYRARYYSTDLGRFISSDPIGAWGDAGSLGNAYAYVGNRVNDQADPSGTMVNGTVCKGAPAITYGCSDIHVANSREDCFQNYNGGAYDHPVGASVIVCYGDIPDDSGSPNPEPWPTPEPEPEPVRAPMPAPVGDYGPGGAAIWQQYEPQPRSKCQQNPGMLSCQAPQMQPGPTFGNCFGGVMGDNGLGLGITWGAAAITALPTGGISLLWALGSTAVTSGAAAISCAGDHTQSSSECMWSAGASLLVGGGSIASSSLRFARRGFAAIFAADVASVGASGGLTLEDLAGC